MKLLRRLLDRLVHGAGRGTDLQYVPVGIDQDHEADLRKVRIAQERFGKPFKCASRLVDREVMVNGAPMVTGAGKLPPTKSQLVAEEQARRATVPQIRRRV